MGKVRSEGEMLGEEKIFTLSYADDMVLIAEEGKMKSIIERLEKYMDRKGLEVKMGKTKIIKFRKESGEGRK